MQGFLDPAILFFVFGMLAGALKSNLEIPPQISRFLSLYLLMALGLKGGFALAASGLTADVIVSLGVRASRWPASCRRWATCCCAASSTASTPRRSPPPTARSARSPSSRPCSTWTNAGLPYGGHMAAAMALMESPAIVMAVLLANWVRQRDGAVERAAPAARPLGKHPARIADRRRAAAAARRDGWSACSRGEAGQAAMKPFAGDLFKGMLAFFLLDMGLLAARNMGELRGKSPWLLVYAVGRAAGPCRHWRWRCARCWACPPGNAALLMVLAASASYIAVPAVIRQAIPEANPSLYFGMSLGLTFPFNILLGIPLYVHVAHRVLVAT